MTDTLEEAEHAVAMGGAADHHSRDSSIQKGRPLLLRPHQFHPVRSATYCLTCRAGLGEKEKFEGNRRSISLFPERRYSVSDL